tara:strand:+ start:110 stop:421 length:312 start_codon:yes stop_codon:yes gene_type:complete
MIKQLLTKDGQVCISLLDVDIDNQEERDKFAYLYMGLEHNVKKKIENAFYKALHQQLIERKQPMVIHKIGGINIIEVHVQDIIDNINIIKHILQSEKGGSIET